MLISVHSRSCFFLAPAEEALEYSVGVFTTGKGEQKSIYQGIGNETDQAWKDLYDRMFFILLSPSSSLPPLLPFPTSMNNIQC
jgi:hypothetical protein